jgi:tryptophan synthase alpha chain
MRPSERLRQALTRQGEPALVAFLTAGYPEPRRFIEVLREVTAVADAVEIGVPFSDPMADGITIQRSSHAAIEHGVSLRWILDQLAAADFNSGAPLLLMSYLNPLLAFGFERLAQRAAEVGVTGLIVPDLPYEESAELREVLGRRGIALVQLVTPATDAKRLRELCAASQGFVYAVTRTGITGSGPALPAALSDYLDRVKAASTLPVCAGFGVRARDQVKLIGKHADGVIVGSALVEVLERGESPAAFLAGLRDAS